MESMIALVMVPQLSRTNRYQRLLRLGGLLMIGYLVFSHGCHGDEDAELFAPAAVLLERMLDHSEGRNEGTRKLRVIRLCHDRSKYDSRLQLRGEALP
jgi:hypothetical protein